MGPLPEPPAGYQWTRTDIGWELRVSQSQREKEGSGFEGVEQDEETGEYLGFHTTGQNDPLPLAPSGYDGERTDIGWELRALEPSKGSDDTGFEGVQHDAETGIYLGFYPTGHQKPQDVSNVHDWVRTDIGWELRPNEHFAEVDNLA